MKLKVFIPVIAVVTLITAGCTTVNNLDHYRFNGKTLEKNMRVPPEPEVDIDFSVKADINDPIGSIFSIGTNILKASEAVKVRKRMVDALSNVNIPGIVETEVYSGFISVLDLFPGEERADYLLDMEIEEYGLFADSGSTVQFRMNIMVRLYHNASRELVWRRRIRHEEKASPYFFGFVNPVDNVITAGVLSELSEERIREGFERLAAEASRKTARKLERDLFKAVY
jgi:hypothetical protein